MAFGSGELDRTFLICVKYLRMKKMLLLLMVIAGGLTASAQPRNDVKTVVLKTPTVQCEKCVKTITENLARYDGIHQVKVNVKAKTTQVKYISDRTNPENIKAAIANAGYDAEEVAANPDSYKLLPKCCKKPEDRH